MDVIIHPPRVMCTGVRYRTRARAKDIACARTSRERKICCAGPHTRGREISHTSGRKISYAWPSR